MEIVHTEKAWVVEKEFEGGEGSGSVAHFREVLAVFTKTKLRAPWEIRWLSPVQGDSQRQGISFIDLL